MKFTVYSSSGETLRTGSCSSDTFELQAGPGETVIEGIKEAKSLPPQYSYSGLRGRAYPPAAEQFDILYHQGFDAWKKVIEGVKLKYPKP